MSEELDVLLEVAARLTRVGLPYMVTGSMAMNVYAIPRMTRDVDLVVELEADEADRLIGVFEGDFYVDRETAREAVARRTMFSLIHQASVMKVDVVVRKDTEFRRLEFGRRRRILVEGRELYIVSPEDLIISKLDWARESRSPLQLDDVRNLLASVKGLDRPLPRRVDWQAGSDGDLSGSMHVTDTTPGMEQRYRNLLLERSGQERLKMGCSMHHLSKRLVLAAIRQDHPHASAAMIRRELFMRFYGRDFEEPVLTRVASAVAAFAADPR